jgi:hypothetical protein
MKTTKPTPTPNPPDISVIQREVQQILQQTQGNAQATAALAGEVLNAFTDLSAQIKDAVAHIDSRFDQLESEINPTFPPTALQFWSVSDMNFVTGIEPKDGVVSQVQVFDQAGNLLPQAQIQWGQPVGESSASDMTELATPDADGMSFDFEPSGTEPTEVITVTATWVDPAGVAPSVSAPLTISLTAASTGGGSTAPTALQFGLVSGT